MSEERRTEIKKLLTDNPETVNYLCSLSEERYQIVFRTMQLVKIIEFQEKLQEDEIETINLICGIYLKENINQIATKAYLYGKIQGKREKRKRRVY